MCVYFQLGKSIFWWPDENALTGVYLLCVRSENSPMLNERWTNISIWKAFNVFLFIKIISIQSSSCLCQSFRPIIYFVKHGLLSISLSLSVPIVTFHQSESESSNNNNESCILIRSSNQSLLLLRFFGLFSSFRFGSKILIAVAVAWFQITRVIKAKSLLFGFMYSIISNH